MPRLPSTLATPYTKITNSCASNGQRRSSGPGAQRATAPQTHQSTPNYAVEDTAGWPELDVTGYGSPAATPFGADSGFDRRFTIVLDRGLTLAGAVPRYAYTINGRALPSTPTQVVRQGDLVMMTAVNRGRDTHPWHLHGHHVLVISRNGRAPTGSPLWMDTFDVRAATG